MPRASKQQRKLDDPSSRISEDELKKIKKNQKVLYDELKKVHTGIRATTIGTKKWMKLKEQEKEVKKQLLELQKILDPPMKVTRRSLWM